MKKCPKCGFNNSDDSAFCQNCGAPLSGQPQASRSSVNEAHHHGSKTLVVILSLVIVALIVFMLFFFFGSHHDNSTAQSQPHHSTATTTRKKPAGKKAAKADALSDKEKIAAVAYYASENNLQSWGKFSFYVKNGAVANHLSNFDDKYDQGSDPIGIHVANTGMGGATFFTTDGDNVYIYYAPDGPIVDGDPDQFKHPQATTTWSDLARLIKDNNVADQIQNVATNTSID